MHSHGPEDGAFSEGRVSGEPEGRHTVMVKVWLQVLTKVVETGKCKALKLAYCAH